MNDRNGTERMRRARRVVVAACMVLVCAASGVAQESATRDRVPTPFGPGEELVFRISYGPVHAGEASLKVRDVIESDGVECYHVESTAVSNRVFSAFYKVRDKVVSHFETGSLVSRYFSKRLHEGEYRKRVQVRFDQEEHLAHYKDGDPLEIPPDCHDILSAFYVVRTLPLVMGESTHVKTHSSRKNYDLEVVVHGRETIEVPAGTFDCLKVQPLVQGEGLFQFEGEIVIWLTDDERRLPVLMKTKVKIGAVDAALTAYTPGELIAAGEDGP